MKLSHKDALNILALQRGVSYEDIKLAYRKACSTYHPDRNAAGLEMMKLINAAYQALSDYVASDTYENDDTDDISLGDELNAALNAIIGLGLEIEICGSWIWVGGDTRPHKDVLKLAGYKWAPVKKLWHFRPSDSKKSFSRGKFSMDDIRVKHGSQAIKNKERARISA